MSFVGWKYLWIFFFNFNKWISLIFCISFILFSFHTFYCVVLKKECTISNIHFFTLFCRSSILLRNVSILLFDVKRLVYSSCKHKFRSLRIKKISERYVRSANHKLFSKWLPKSDFLFKKKKSILVLRSNKRIKIFPRDKYLACECYVKLG